MDSLLIMELKIFSTILGHASFKGYEIWSKKIEQYEICDGFYNYLLCVIKSKEFKVHHISKGMFFMTNIK
jgi:hypothetical protein